MTTMSIFPDPDSLRARAARIGLHAAAVRSRADTLDSAIAGLSWRGVAADAFRVMIGSVPSGLRTSAGDLDRAAQALRDLAANVESLLDDLSRSGLDVLSARDDILGALRDGTDLRVLIQHPGSLLQDGITLSRDGVHLAADGVDLAGDAASGIAHGVTDGVKSLGSLVGI